MALHLLTVLSSILTGLMACLFFPGFFRFFTAPCGEKGGYANSCPHNQNRITNPDLCHLLISGKSVDHAGHKRNLLFPLWSKVLPSRRLHVAFGIENAFTSTDEEYVKQLSTMHALLSASRQTNGTLSSDSLSTLFWPGLLRTRGQG